MSPRHATRAAPERPRYHHGNLRAALIEAGLKLIEEKGVRALTLREIGTRVGVSRTAAYRHFESKEQLLGAICEAGFLLFGDALEAARSRAPKDFASRLSSMALAYVRFSWEHPAYYEVMFSPASLASKPTEAGKRAFEILESTIREAQESGEVRSESSRLLAQLVWSTVHGISTLKLATDFSSHGSGSKFVSTCSEIMRSGLEAGST